MGCSSSKENNVDDPAQSSRTQNRNEGEAVPKPNSDGTKGVEATQCNETHKNKIIAQLQGYFNQIHKSNQPNYCQFENLKNLTFNEIEEVGKFLNNNTQLLSDIQNNKQKSESSYKEIVGEILQKFDTNVANLIKNRLDGIRVILSQFQAQLICLLNVADLKEKLKLQSLFELKHLQENIVDLKMAERLQKLNQTIEPLNQQTREQVTKKFIDLKNYIGAWLNEPGNFYVEIYNIEKALKEIFQKATFLVSPLKAEDNSIEQNHRKISQSESNNQNQQEIVQVEQLLNQQNETTLISNTQMLSFQDPQYSEEKNKNSIDVLWIPLFFCIQIEGGKEDIKICKHLFCEAEASINMKGKIKCTGKKCFQFSVENAYFKKKDSFYFVVDSKNFEKKKWKILIFNSKSIFLKALDQGLEKIEDQQREIFKKEIQEQPFYKRFSE